MTWIDAFCTSGFRAGHWFALLAAALVLCGACGTRSQVLGAGWEGSAGAGPDEGIGGRATQLRDAGSDVPADARPDASVISVDSGLLPDASVFDAGADVSVRDAAPDVSVYDSGPDALEDARADAELDASEDADASDPPPPPCIYDWECDDAVVCTYDLCDRATARCYHTPVDDWCPTGHHCTLEHGCETYVIANSAYVLYRVTVPSGDIFEIGSLTEDGRVASRQIGDVARHPNGTLLAADFSHVFVISDTGEIIETVADHDATINALGCTAGGTVFAAGGDTIYHVDIALGVVDVVARLPEGSRSSGDLVFMDDRILVTTRDTAPTDVLVSIDPSTGEVVELGELGYSCVYGLVAVGSLLYGFECNGHILNINPWTAETVELSDTDIAFRGAAPL
jgi:hypothetical protein